MKRRHAKTLFLKCGSYGCDCGGDYGNGSGSEFVSESVSESVSGPSMLLSVAQAGLCSAEALAKVAEALAEARV